MLEDLKNLLLIKSTEYYPLVYIPDKISKCLNNKSFFEVDDDLVIRKYKLLKPEQPEVLINPPPQPGDYFFVDERKWGFHEKGILHLIIIIFLFSLMVIWTVNLVNLAKLKSFEDFVLLWTFFIIPIIIYFFKHVRKYEKFRKSYKYVSRSTFMMPAILFSFGKIPSPSGHGFIDESKLKISNPKYYQAYIIHERAVKNYKKYEDVEKEYKEKLNKFNILINSRKEEYIQSEYKEILKVAIKPIRSSESTKKGKTETFFLDYLLQSFDDKIKIDMEINAYGTSYYPDFVYESNNHGFYIDIEIDEQYDSVNKKPIHFIGGDDLRNNFFLTNNWFIIRFAEKQIIDEPDTCVNFIIEIIKQIKCPLYNTKINHCPQTIKRWTYEEIYLKTKNKNH